MHATSGQLRSRASLRNPGTLSVVKVAFLCLVSLANLRFHAYFEAFACAQHTSSFVLGTYEMGEVCIRNSVRNAKPVVGSTICLAARQPSALQP